MVKSMTGFGRGTIEEGGRSFTVEIKTVNHRYLDFNIRLPKNLISLEERIRKSIQDKLSRGKVDVFIIQNNYVKEDLIANLNSALADSYFSCLNEIKGRYAVKDDISVCSIARFPEVITLSQQEEDIEVIWQTLNKGLNLAIDSIINMRELEGERLKKDILFKCENLKVFVANVEERAPLVVIEYKEKLKNRLNELLENTSIDENRIAMEVAIMADKSCIDEEIVRLKSHIVSMEDTIGLNEPIGRKLDFIVQEMNREANTIASKANDIFITNVVLNIKNEIEKIREQIQNIE